MRLLALDFDGVISDSAPEAFVVALRTYVASRASSSFAADAAQLRGETPPTPDQVRSQALFAPFLDRMPLGNRAEDYAVVLASIEAGRELSDQAEYDAFRDTLDPQWLRAYHKQFYHERAALASVDEAAWLRLMSPYPPILGVLRRRSCDAILCIATAKDRGSVGRLLRAYGIDDLFPAGRVLDKEAGREKSAHVATLREVFDVDFPDITFVDDKVNHLEAVGRLGVRCALATWGFNGRREIDRALAAGFLVCSLADVEERLFG